MPFPRHFTHIYMIRNAKPALHNRSFVALINISIRMRHASRVHSLYFRLAELGVEILSPCRQSSRVQLGVSSAPFRCGVAQFRLALGLLLLLEGSIWGKRERAGIFPALEVCVWELTLGCCFISDYYVLSDCKLRILV